MESCKWSGPRIPQRSHLERRGFITQRMIRRLLKVPKSQLASGGDRCFASYAPPLILCWLCEHGGSIVCIASWCQVGSHRESQQPICMDTKEIVSTYIRKQVQMSIY